MLSIDRRSLLYHLATTYGRMDSGLNYPDLCRLTCRVLLGCLSIAGIVAVGAFAGAAVGDVGLWIWTGLTIAWVDLIGPGVLLLALTITALLFVILGGTAYVWFKYSDTVFGRTVTKYTRETYLGFKEKYCPTVKVTD